MSSVSRDQAVAELGLLDGFDASKLGQLKAIATKEVDLRKLELLQVLMADLADQSFSLDEKKEELASAVRKAVAALKEEIQAAEDDRDDKELQIREKIDSQFTFARESQLEDLEKVEKARNARERRIRDWTPASWMQKRELAKRIALGGEHEKAREVMAAADAEREQQRETRLQEVNKETEEIIKHRLERYQEGLQALQGRLTQGLNENTEAYESAIARAKRRANVYIDCARKRAMGAILLRGEFARDRGQVADALTAQLSGTVKAEAEQLRQGGAEELANIVLGLISSAA